MQTQPVAAALCSVLRTAQISGPPGPNQTPSASAALLKHLGTAPQRVVQVFVAGGGDGDLELVVSLRPCSDPTEPAQGLSGL